MKLAALPRWIAIVVLAAACDPAGTTGTIPPTGTTAPTDVPAKNPPTTAGPAACPVGPASPLTLQLDALKFSAMMQAMDQGIVVVAFDCIDLAVLDSCLIEGQYDFVAGTRAEVDRRFTSRSETEAATRLWGSTSTPPLHIEPGETLALKLVAIGQIRANVSSAAKKDLQGDCARATHFLRAAPVGAFELTGKRGTSTHETKAGDLQECSQPRPPGCTSPLQLELVPIGS